jgi:hypothetical protein
MERQEKIRLLEKLAEDPAYLYLNSLMQEQADQLQSDCFTPCPTLDSTLLLEYKKGQLEGRTAWEAVRKTTIEALQSEARYYKEQQENASTSEDNSTSGDSDKPASAP